MLPKNGFDSSISFENHMDWQISFISTLCPHCGWNLEGERDSLVLLCKNCHSIWKSGKNGFRRLNFAVITNKEENALYLPFWRIKPQIEGLKIQSYADLVRIANLPKAIKKEWEDLEFFFWVPAFKVSPSLFLKLTKRMTLSHIKEKFKESFPKSSYYPVTLPSSEAVEALKVNLANLVVAKKTIFPILSEIDIKLKEILLVYFPFILKGNEFIQSSIQLSINKNALNFGRVQ
jgi:hypothetical protein